LLALAAEFLELFRHPGGRHRLECATLLICRHESLSSKPWMITPMPPLCPCPARCVQSVGWIGSSPADVGSRSVSGRYPVFQQPKANANLGSMVGRMQHSSPENPDPLPGHVEEWDFVQPEVLLC